LANERKQHVKSNRNGPYSGFLLKPIDQRKYHEAIESKGFFTSPDTKKKRPDKLSGRFKNQLQLTYF